MIRPTKTAAFVAALALLALAGCSAPTSTEDGLAGTFNQAGSSTVLPIAQLWAEDFEAEHPNVKFIVEGGGSGSGIAGFCRGELHIADASRPIKSTETEACRAAGIEPFEIEVAIDGLALAVSTQNSFVDHLTVAELNKVWTANTSKQVNRWNQLRPEWPDERIQLFGPGTNSGTFDYFVEVIITPFDGTATKGRNDYTPSEDDHVLVQGVKSSPYALGYFGLSYVQENSKLIKAVPIDEGKGKGPIAPTAQTVEAGDYTPLARPLFMYTNGAPTGVLHEYFRYGLSDAGQDVVEEVGYIGLPAAKLAEMHTKVGVA